MNKLRLNMNDCGERGEPFFFMVDFELQNPIFHPLASLPPGIIIDMPLFSNAGSSSPKPEKIVINRNPVSYNTYSDSFRKVMAEINYGNSYLVNLTFPTQLEINLSMEEIFNASRAKYRLMVDNRFVLFSPEIFVRIKDDRIFSYPMKGTIDASIPDAERILLEDIKELSEHNTIVDLIRNDLSTISNNVSVTRYRYIDTIETSATSLLQVSSEIEAELGPGWAGRLGDIILPLLPAGSVSGAPKKETLRIIAECEHGPRGYYTGVFGVFDGKSFDSSVMIRYIEQKDGIYVYRSGGGVTSLSDPVKEYNELLDKIYVPFS